MTTDNIQTSFSVHWMSDNYQKVLQKPLRFPIFLVQCWNVTGGRLKVISFQRDLSPEALTVFQIHLKNCESTDTHIYHSNLE